MSDENAVNPSSNAPHREIPPPQPPVPAPSKPHPAAPPRLDGPRLLGGVVDIDKRLEDFPPLPVKLPPRADTFTLGSLSLTDALSTEIDSVLQGVEPGHFQADVFFRLGNGLYIATAYRANEHFEVGGIVRATQRDHELHLEAGAKLRISF